MKARTAIIELLKESREWRDFFRSCYETSTLCLRSQVWKLADELADQGHHIWRGDRERPI
jgi:hypothetical protein